MAKSTKASTTGSKSDAQGLEGRKAPAFALHDRGVRLPRSCQGNSRAGGRSRRGQRRFDAVSSEVYREVFAQLSAAERSRQQGHESLRGLQEEVAVRARVHGNRADHVRNRSRRQGAQGVSEGEGERTHRGSARRVERDEVSVSLDIRSRLPMLIRLFQHTTI